MNNSCRIDVTPQKTMGDEPLKSVVVNGLSPDTEVTITASTVDDSGGVWKSFGTFRSDESGVIDLSLQAPFSGTFSEIDPSALLWAMRPDGNTEIPVPRFDKPNTTQLTVEVDVTVHGESCARTSIERIFCSDNTVKEPINADGVIGTLYYPADGKPHPVVICLSGSGGGIPNARASLLAAHGYTALALGYFGVEGLPAELFRIPLEFFDRGLAWLRNHEAADCNRLAVYGYSKGGELAVLLGSLHPEIKATVAYSGSSYVWQGLHRGAPGSSWAKNGKELPFVPMKLPLKTMINFFRGRKIAFRESYIRGLKGFKNLEKSTIAIENAGGPVFLVAGTDDQVWPAADFSDVIAERMKKSQYRCEYMKEEGAGHLVGLPYLPSAEFTSNLVFTSSNIELSSKAVVKAWQSMVKFLQTELQPGE